MSRGESIETGLGTRVSVYGYGRGECREAGNFLITPPGEALSSQPELENAAAIRFAAWTVAVAHKKSTTNLREKIVENFRPLLTI